MNIEGQTRQSDAKSGRRNLYRLVADGPSGMDVKLFDSNGNEVPLDQCLGMKIELRPQAPAVVSVEFLCVIDVQGDIELEANVLDLREGDPPGAERSPGATINIHGHGPVGVDDVARAIDESVHRRGMPGLGRPGNPRAG